MSVKLSILLAFSCLFTLPAFAQEKSKKELKAEQELKKQKEIEALIDSKNFAFEAQKATPQGGRLLNLDYNTYFLKFNEANTTCDLPFFGRAYNVAYGGDGGIKFEGVPENTRIEKSKKKIIVRSTVKGKNDVYDLLLTVFFNGDASLSVNSNNRAPISYDGVVEAPKTDEVKK
ncbi:DUF4251 domain-containing protein [Flavobacterium sp. LHD-80]|uniref:DUF4251 domain-containing protein n=1 Tax=Flavobacterium sp. LHD-80 TaxID=3071411 RepID=UPI0027E19F9E|nr:DUF4251 domain-containing protein [Flavobacterium sp. LHD-80]MDQ6470765.1 DUF4251 domain-containing protein [Flavobacterium sp. LHD-80]